MADHKPFTQVEGMRVYTGGEELRRAAAALSGPSLAPRPNVNLALPAQQAGHVDRTGHTSKTSSFNDRRDSQDQPEAFQKIDSQSTNFEAVYNDGLILQEKASQAGGSAQGQLDLLKQACDKYHEAWELQTNSHAALYNWGVALSDMAHLEKKTEDDAAYHCLLAAAEKYALSLFYSPNNPQALNNWGLVLQELSTMRSPAERILLVQQSVAKFRRAIRLRPEFDRACYNLGTVYYAHACSLQGEVQNASAQQEAVSGGAEPTSEAVLRRTFALAAQYILLSYVLQPAKEVYSKSLQVIKQLLPLPHLRAGRLLAVAADSLGAVPERWLVSMFVLDQAGFRIVAPHDQPAASSQQVAAESQESHVGEESQKAQQESGSGDEQQPDSYQIGLSDVACVKPCNDPSLPPGYAFWVSLHSRTQGLYFVAQVSEDAEGWVDALHMASYAAKQGRMQMLANALALASGDQQYQS
ncbi:hypothetical protein ABBQ38_002540 [Trebouxia sp. C0009 RCD-2024]